MREKCNGIFLRIKISILGEICRVQLADRKQADDLLMMLTLNEAIDKLLVANSEHLCCHVTRMKDGHEMRRAIELLRLKVK